jgi:hypothetical protein
VQVIMPGSRAEIVMLRPPGGGTGLELSSFTRPDHEPGSPGPMPNEPGLRNVGDLQAILGRLAADRCRLAGGVGQYGGNRLVALLPAAIYRWVSQRMPWPVPMTPTSVW